jgi:hypothetical protein
MFSVLNPFSSNISKISSRRSDDGANIGYNAASPFSWKEIQLFGKHCPGYPDLGYHPLRLHQRQQLSFSTKVSNSSCALHLLLLVKDRLILLIIIVNCRLFVHSKRYRTDHQYRICCLFHFVFFYVVLSRVHIH